MTRSCLTAPSWCTWLIRPCCLSRVRTSATTNPARWIASWIAFHTALLLLWNSTVIHRPGLRTRAVLSEAGLHEALVVGEALALAPVDDRLRGRRSSHTRATTQPEVEVGVVDVVAERRVGEDVVDRWSGGSRHSLRAGDMATGLAIA